MRRFRFTIGGILALVLFLGVAIAALREANEGWDSVVFGLTLVALLTALLLTVHSRETSRAFWLGFVIFGGVYLVSSLVPPVESRLPTTKLLAFLDSKLPGRNIAFSVSLAPINVPAGNGTAASVSSSTFVLNTVTATTPGQGGNLVVRPFNGFGWFATSPLGLTEHFVGIGHSLIALLVAMVGGWLSRRIHASHTGLPAADVLTPDPIAEEPDRLLQHDRNV